MAPRPKDIVVIGASAGGLDALKHIVAALPAEFPAAVFVVVHTAPENPSVLPRILARCSSLVCAHARDGEPIERGRLYVAPPNHHLIVKPGFVRVPRGPKENGFRPAIDPLFRTAATAYDERVVGIVLSGALDDGADGLRQIKEAGGTAIVQDPEEALIPSMPLAAIRDVEIDHILRVADIAPVLMRLADAHGGQEILPMAIDKQVDIDFVERTVDELRRGAPEGVPSPFTCPECGGALREILEKGLLRFRCYVGHSYTPESMLAGQHTRLETALWSALRALEENAALRRHMAQRAHDRAMTSFADDYARRARESELRAEIIREVLTQGPAAIHEAPPPSAGPHRRRSTSGRAGAVGHEVKRGDPSG